MLLFRGVSFFKIQDELKKLKNKFEHLMEMDHIGHSFEGRPLLQVHVSTFLLKLCYMMMIMVMMMMIVAVMVRLIYGSNIRDDF